MLCTCCGSWRGQSCTRAQGFVWAVLVLVLRTYILQSGLIFIRAYVAYHLKTGVGRQDGSETTPVHWLNISDRIESREGSLECKGSLGNS